MAILVNGFMDRNLDGHSEAHFLAACSAPPAQALPTITDGERKCWVEIVPRNFNLLARTSLEEPAVGCQTDAATRVVCLQVGFPQTLRGWRTRRYSEVSNDSKMIQKNKY